MIFANTPGENAEPAEKKQVPGMKYGNLCLDRILRRKCIVMKKIKNFMIPFNEKDKGRKS